MKMFTLCFVVISIPLFAMDSENSSLVEEIQKIFNQYKEEEPELLKKYSKAVIECQRTPSPDNRSHLNKIKERIDSPKTKIRKHLQHPHSEYFDPSKIEQSAFKRIAPHIVRKKDS